jgi:hypothetical protein
MSFSVAVTSHCSRRGWNLRVRDRWAQLQAELGEVIITAGAIIDASRVGVSVMVRVADASAHFARAKAHSVAILSEPTDYPYGERQYSAQDLAGYERLALVEEIWDSIAADAGTLPLTVRRDPAAWQGRT